MSKKEFLVVLITLLVSLSFYFIYRYAVILKSEKNDNSYNSVSDNYIDNNNDNFSNQKSKNNSSSYRIPNVEIKSLTYDKYDEKDRSKKIIEIKVDYLVIENKNSLESVEKLNNKLKKDAEEALNATRQEFEEGSEYCPDIQYVSTDKSEIKKNNKHGIISVSSWLYYDRGGAHPWSFTNSFVVDCTRGKKLSIFDVINGNKNDVVNMIKQETIKYILELSKDSGTFDEEKIKNQLYIDDKTYEDWDLQDFYLCDGSLVVEFSTGDIAPAVLGLISVDIPYDVVKNYGLSIDPKFIE